MWLSHFRPFSTDIIDRPGAEDETRSNNNNIAYASHINCGRQNAVQFELEVCHSAGSRGERQRSDLWRDAFSRVGRRPRAIGLTRAKIIETNKEEKRGPCKVIAKVFYGRRNNNFRVFFLFLFFLKRSARFSPGRFFLFLFTQFNYTFGNTLILLENKKFLKGKKRFFSLS